MSFKSNGLVGDACCLPVDCFWCYAAECHRHCSNLILDFSDYFWRSIKLELAPLKHKSIIYWLRR